MLLVPEICLFCFESTLVEWLGDVCNCFRKRGATFSVGLVLCSFTPIEVISLSREPLAFMCKDPAPFEAAAVGEWPLRLWRERPGKTKVLSRFQPASKERRFCRLQDIGEQREGCKENERQVLPLGGSGPPRLRYYPTACGLVDMLNMLLIILIALPAISGLKDVEATFRTSLVFAWYSSRGVSRHNWIYHLNYQDGSSHGHSSSRFRVFLSISPFLCLQAFVGVACSGVGTCAGLFWQP